MYKTLKEAQEMFGEDLTQDQKNQVDQIVQQRVNHKKRLQYLMICQLNTHYIKVYRGEIEETFNKMYLKENLNEQTKLQLYEELFLLLMNHQKEYIQLYEKVRQIENE